MMSKRDGVVVVVVVVKHAVVVLRRAAIATQAWQAGLIAIRIEGKERRGGSGRWRRWRCNFRRRWCTCTFQFGFSWIGCRDTLFLQAHPGLGDRRAGLHARPDSGVF